MEYHTTYGLNAMEIVESNFFLGYIYTYMLYEDPKLPLVEQRKEVNFDIFIPHYTFGMFLIVGCMNLITHALLCPIPHKLNAPIP
jgi:hypothetical protein